MKPYLFFIGFAFACLILQPYALGQEKITRPTTTNQKQGRTIVAEQSMPFEADTDALAAAIAKLEAILTCKETFEDLDGLMLSDSETLDVLQNSGQEHAEHAIPFFMDLQKQLKEALKPHYSQTKSVKLIYHNQRYGVSSNMKIIGIGIHIVQKDGTPIPFRLQLVEYNGAYRLFSLDA